MHMAKKKKRSSSSSTSSSSKKGLNRGVVHQIKLLLGTLLFLFVFASIFDKAGTLGTTLYKFFHVLIGQATPLLAVLMLWFAAKRLFPHKVHVRFFTAVGTFLFFIGLTGVLHSLVKGDLADAAANGLGGGWVGHGMFNTLNTAFGEIVGRLILIIICVISLMLLLDKALVPFLKPAVQEEEDTEEELDEGTEQEPRVRVAGELKAGPLKRLLGKPKEMSIEPNKNKVAVATLSRSSDWNYPPLTLLDLIDMKPQAGNIQKRMETIQKTLRDFSIDVTMSDVNIGPTVTQYTLKPADGVKLNQITARQDDMALALAAESLRVEAPIPGKGLVGVEIPNEKKAMVGVRDVLQSKQFQQLNSKLGIVLGRDAAGEPAVADLAKMPHVLIAGSTGSGKSVCINTIILSLLMNNSPDELRMILVDPKRVELAAYNGLPHLLTPVITEPRDTVIALKRMVEEMERRYKLFASHGKRNIEQYNQDPTMADGKLPFIVVVIDELADLMMVSARDVESKIVRLAQMARAVGIHLIVATQRPSVDVITGLIKANIPTRIAFAVTSQVDSRTIIDGAGAEKLLGQGDMLYISTEVGRPKRIQGAFSSEKELTSVIAHIRIQEPGDHYDPSFLEEPVESRFGGGGGGLDPEEEGLVLEAYELFQKHNKASTSMLQTYMRLGYNKAKRIVATMEERGMIGPDRGGRQREVHRVDSGAESDSFTSQSEEGIAAFPDNE
jgi:S-DNA-T family DNA segregation ATPase FtsK/SpoIIIE